LHFVIKRFRSFLLFFILFLRFSRMIYIYIYHNFHQLSTTLILSSRLITRHFGCSTKSFVPQHREITSDNFRWVHASLFALLRPINPYKPLYRHNAIARGEVTLSDVDCYQWMRDDDTHYLDISFIIFTCEFSIYVSRGKNAYKFNDAISRDIKQS